ncbi:MAG: PhzF family phenazine biosynthesis protein [Chitinophagaceae bacterium]|jgi:PhzF family phenazine biosynthesis protein
MKLKIYQLDAFADKVFSGNPAAVCPLNEWLSDELLQQIAMENNLAETAFYTRKGDSYEIRWFTPTVEVDLCGHATLAAAYVLFHHENHTADQISFYSPRSGELSVKKNGDLLTLNFPTDLYESVALTEGMNACFEVKSLQAFKGKTDFMLVFATEEEIINARPNLSEISKLEGRGVIITARGREADFVSRFFAPQSGIDEDPVTGSAHTTLAPFWAKELGKNELSAIQLSPRRGYLQCNWMNDRVEISGTARLYMSGELFIS